MEYSLKETTIRLATNKDAKFLIEHEHSVAKELLLKKIADSLIYVMETETAFLAGWLRWGLFWDCIPFMNMLYFIEPYRRKGFGGQLVIYWEEEMKKLGFSSVLTSTQVNEDAQHFYRKLGYQDAGTLLFPGEPAELFLRKKL